MGVGVQLVERRVEFVQELGRVRTERVVLPLQVPRQRFFAVLPAAVAVVVGEAGGEGRG